VRAKGRLEFDHRNLDRRFFPGLIFNYVDSTNPDPQRVGAHLVSVDLHDPDLHAGSGRSNRLATGAGILRTAKTLGVGTGTVHRVKREMATGLQGS